MPTIKCPICGYKTHVYMSKYTPTAIHHEEQRLRRYHDFRIDEYVLYNGEIGKIVTCSDVWPKTYMNNFYNKMALPYHLLGVKLFSQIALEDCAVIGPTVLEKIHNTNSLAVQEYEDHLALRLLANI